jgi:lipoprotein-anchoring transpeptidase ErfK/SrfK
VTVVLTRLSALLALLALAACGAAPKETPPPAPVEVAGYGAVQDGEYLIPAVEPLHLFGTNAKAEVAYDGDEAPGTVVVDTFARHLYLVQENGRALRYAIAVGREGLSFRGTGVIGRKQEWPSWQPTSNMLKTRPDMYGDYAAGLPGGLDNPLGARAMYLYRGGRDTMFRIHGTIDNASIGRATSAGCIRLFNQDAIDLFDRVDIGAKVKVRTEEESLAAEGPYMDDAYGRAVPETPSNIAQKERDIANMAANEAAKADAERAAAEAAAKAAEKVDRRRLAKCRNKGISENSCPLLPEADMAISQG